METLHPVVMAGVAGNGNISGKNSTDNVTVDRKKMTLDDARYELQRRGFTIHEHPSYDNDSHSFVGVKSTWRSTLNKFDVMIFVHEIQPSVESGDGAVRGGGGRSSGELTIQRIENNIEELQSHLIVDYQPDGCPPHGVSRARLVLLIYLTPHAFEKIDPVVLRKVCATPAKEWCAVTFLAAQDGSDKQAYFMSERDTPYWGKALFPEIFYYANVVTGKPNMPDTPPSLPLWYKLMLLFSFIFIIGQGRIQFIIHFIIVFIAAASIATICHWYRRHTMTGGGTHNRFVTDEVIISGVPL